MLTILARGSSICLHHGHRPNNLPLLYKQVSLMMFNRKLLVAVGGYTHGLTPSPSSKGPFQRGQKQPGLFVLLVRNSAAEKAEYSTCKETSKEVHNHLKLQRRRQTPIILVSMQKFIVLYCDHLDVKPSCQWSGATQWEMPHKVQQHGLSCWPERLVREQETCCLFRQFYWRIMRRIKWSYHL